MASLISNSYVLVTGGSGGIGAALCRRLPSIGCLPVVAYDGNEASANAVARDTGGFAVKMDLRRDESIETAVKHMTEEFGRRKLLVDSAESPAAMLSGVVLGASGPPDLLPFSKLNAQHLQDQFRVNVIGSHLLLSCLIREFFRKQKSGTVVGILSEAIGTEGQGPATGMGAYIIAKAALKTMLAVCAAEHPWLRVETVSPGFTRTKMLDVFDPRYLELVQGQKKFSMPEEIAERIVQRLRPDHFV